MLCNGGKRFSYKYPNTVFLGGMNLHPWSGLRHSPSAWLSWLINSSDDTRVYLVPRALSESALLHNITFILGRHANWVAEGFKLFGSFYSIAHPYSWLQAMLFFEALEIFMLTSSTHCLKTTLFIIWSTVQPVRCNAAQFASLY
jgi:hypothetical protein